MSDSQSGLNKRDAKLVVLKLVALVLLAVVLSGLPWVNETIIAPIDRFTALVFTGIARLLGCDLQNFDVSVVGTLFGTSINVRIGYGCDGVLAFLILVCGVLPLPVSWRWKGIGVGLGLLYVFAINQVRIAALVLALLTNPSHERFEFYHIYAGQLFAIVMVFMFWSNWLNRALGPAQDD